MDIENILRIVEQTVGNFEDELAVPKVWEVTKDPFWVLIATVISVRTKEEQTIKTAFELYNKAKTPWDILNLSDKELFDILRKTGLATNKVRWIKEIAKKWIERCKRINILSKEDYLKKYRDCVFCDEDWLLSLPGVGRKVMNVYLNLVCGKSVIAVDTHVHRIANRLGWVNTKTPDQTEKELYKVIPQKWWRKINYILVKFGRSICKPSNPNCKVCPIKTYCKYYSEKK